MSRSNSFLFLSEFKGIERYCCVVNAKHGKQFPLIVVIVNVTYCILVAYFSVDLVQCIFNGAQLCVGKIFRLSRICHFYFLRIDKFSCSKRQGFY